MEKMNKEKFIEELKKINIELSEHQLNQLDIYCNYLLEINKITNLTAIRNEEDVYLKHFYDSITITKIIDLNNIKKVIDVGTGAGFPGMIIKIINPNIELTLLDSNNKKISFLKELADKLNFDDIEFINDRAEDYYNEVGNIYDLVVARAVSNLSILSELCIPLLKIGGIFVSMKSQATEEIEEAKYGINILGGTINNIIEFDLPIENSKRTLIKIDKIKDTPKEYPRRYEKIIKNPLKKRIK